MTYRINLQNLAHVCRRTALLLPDTHDRWNCDHRDHDAWNYRPRNLQLRVAVNLLRYRVVPLPITPHGIDDQTLDDYEHDHRYPEDQVEQVSLIARDRTVASESRLRMLRRTCHQRECKRECREHDERARRMRLDQPTEPQMHVAVFNLWALDFINTAAVCTISNSAVDLLNICDADSTKS